MITCGLRPRPVFLCHTSRVESLLSNDRSRKPSGIAESAGSTDRTGSDEHTHGHRGSLEGWNWEDLTLRILEWLLCSTDFSTVIRRELSGSTA